MKPTGMSAEQAYALAQGVPMKRPINDEYTVHLRVSGGVLNRIDRIKGDTKQHVFIRELIEKALYAEERRQRREAKKTGVTARSFGVDEPDEI